MNNYPPPLTKLVRTYKATCVLCLNSSSTTVYTRPSLRYKHCFNCAYAYIESYSKMMKKIRLSRNLESFKQ